MVAQPMPSTVPGLTFSPRDFVLAWENGVGAGSGEISIRTSISHISSANSQNQPGGACFWGDLGGESKTGRECKSLSCRRLLSRPRENGGRSISTPHHFLIRYDTLSEYVLSRVG